MKKFISVIMALALVSCMSIVAAAKDSPTATKITTTKRTTTTTKGKNEEKKEYDDGIVVIKTDPNTKEVTYTVNPKDGYDFTKWNIDGDYTIVSGSLTSRTITIIFNKSTKANATPNFKKGSGTSGEDSPKTGDNGAYVILFGAIALGTVVISKKRLAK